MPITGQPFFNARDVPTPTQMTAWMATITAKFAAAMSTDDFQWPMAAGGHLDMDGNSFTSIPRIGSSYNVALRRHWQTTKMIFDEVEAKGGGQVVLPGNTTIGAQTDKDGLTGIRVGTNIRFTGHGHSSICGQLYIKKKNNLIVENMQITGNSELRNCHDVIFQNVNFTATSGASHIKLKDCKKIRFVNCTFTGAVTNNIHTEASYGTRIRHCHFTDWDDVSIYIVLEEGSSGTTGVRIVDNVFRHPTAYAGSTNYCVRFEVNNLQLNTLLGRAIFKNSLAKRNVFQSNMLMDKSGGIEVAGLQNIHIQGNYFGDTSTTTTMIFMSRADASTFWFGGGPVVQSNIIQSGVDIGLRIALYRNAVIRGNVMFCADECLILQMSFDTASNTLRGTASTGGMSSITGNTFWTADGTLPATTLWNLQQAPTRRNITTVMAGNHMDSGGTRGFQCFRGNGSSAGGSIGDVTTLSFKPYWIFVGNNAQGALVGTADTDDISHNTGNKSLVLSTVDDSTPVNNV